MKAMDEKKEKDATVIRAVSRGEEGAKNVELETRKVETMKYVERKLNDKGVLRMNRHPGDGIGIGRPPPKSGHGGKCTWKGPEAELSPTPPAVDERDPKYVEEGEREDEEVREYIVGEVEVPKVEEEGVARIDVDSKLNANLEV